VRAHDGTPGVAFLSIEARNPLAVLVARAWFGVPYHLARMRTMGDGRTVTFHSQRRRPHGSALLDLVLTVGDPIPPGSLTELDRFLTMRWAFFGLRHGLLRRTAIDHAEWPLHRAVAERADQTLLAAVGLPKPTEPPLVHYSPGVTAHFGRATPA
jgi:uncharacterized protein YqjF (DUF2071 family)